jgi:hypothetical protein
MPNISEVLERGSFCVVLFFSLRKTDVVVVEDKRCFLGLKEQPLSLLRNSRQNNLRYETDSKGGNDEFKNDATIW